MAGTGVRGLIAVTALLSTLASGQGWASEMTPEEARRFVVGKYFTYTCFEGTSGAGRINADGSVAGTIKVRGSGPARHVALPANTLRVRGGSVCAAVRGVPFEPCFNLSKTGNSTFRGAISGFGFAYCDFQRRNPRLNVARGPLQLRGMQASRDD